MNLYEFDGKYRREAVRFLCGVDEAGRGPLAGPVYAAAVILPPGVEIQGLNDSKKLTEKRREGLFDQIRELALCYCVASADEGEIDAVNILQASLLAMARAVEGLKQTPDLALIDGNQLPRLEVPAVTVVKGDATSACIAAASILAKVSRDRRLLELDREYPQYAFAKHKGYPTKLHYQMLDQHGPSPVHRRTFLKKWEAGRAR